MAGHRLRLLYGNDKRNPIEVFDIASLDTTDSVRLNSEGFKPVAGEKQLSYRENYYLNGKQRYHSKTDNIKLKIEYHLHGSSATDLANIESGIDLFLEQVRLYHEWGQGEKCWLEECRDDGLNGVGSVLFGQRQRYYEIIDIVPSYPDDLYGIDLATNRINPILELECAPFVEGLEQIAGDTNRLENTDVELKISYDLSYITLPDNYTITGWVTHKGENYLFFEYYYDANNWAIAFYNDAAEYIEFNYKVGGSTTNLQSSVISASGAVQLVFSNSSDNDEGTIYLNGSSIITTGEFVDLPSGGKLNIGNDNGATFAAYHSTHDGWKIFSSALTNTEQQTLYNNEKPIKDAGRWIAKPLYHKTVDGDGVYNAVIDRVDLSGTISESNWGVVANVPGNVPAKVKWVLTDFDIAPQELYYLGNKILDEEQNFDVTFLDFGSSDSGSGTGDYTFTQEFHAPETIQFRRRFQVLAYAKSNATVTLKPFFQIGQSTSCVFDGTTIASSSSYALFDLGSIFINWPELGTTQKVSSGLVATRATTATVYVNFIFLVPWPSCKVEGTTAGTVATNDKITIEGRNSYLTDTSDDDAIIQRYAFEGDEVCLWPKKFNHIYLYQGAIDGTFDDTVYCKLKAYVTPRWVMGGGPVG